VPGEVIHHRLRWFNQLHPDIVKEQVWLPQEEETLFSLQEKHGNHWAKISRGLPGRSDNSIKNYFYSCLRKALRKVNNYVYNNKRLVPYKNIKPFQKSTLSKILAVAENKAENKVSIAKEDAPLIARGTCPLPRHQETAYCYPDSPSISVLRAQPGYHDFCCFQNPGIQPDLQEKENKKESHPDKRGFFVPVS
jgi:hypothetical protein